jgi:uncharacterized protein YrrD
MLKGITMSLQRIAELTAFSVSASDGEIGSINDILFDDTNWRVRYLVIRSGGWLDERMVLVIPHAFLSADLTERAIQLPLSREQIQQSPAIDTDPPVYRQQALAAATVFPPMWATYSGMYEPFLFPYALLGMRDVENGAADKPPQYHHDPHLRSAHEVIGYRIEDDAGEAGQVTDLILDDEDWTIRYAVIQTGSWFARKQTLAPTSNMAEISWHRRVLKTTLLREQLVSGPEYSNTLLLAPVFESHLRQHYLGNTPMRLDELRGRPIFDGAQGTLLGTIDDLYLDAGAERCVAVLIRTGGMFSRRTLAILISDILVLGEDAWLAKDAQVTLPSTQYEQETGNIPARHLVGRRVVSEGSTPLGTLGQPIIRRDTTVEGFELHAVYVEGPLGERRYIARAALTSMGDGDQPATTTLAAAERSLQP